MTNLNESYGKRRTPEYNAWASMRDRCRRHPDYAGRGVTVCKRWDNYENFLADMGRRGDAALSLDRINNDGDYEPTNCRWATKKEQATNRRQRLDKNDIHAGRVKDMVRQGVSLRAIGRYFGFTHPTSRRLWKLEKENAAD